MLHILRLRLPNIYLLTGDRSVLVDSGGPADVPRILAFLQAHGVAPAQLALILFTHGHWDHAGGAAQLRRATGTPIAIHRADADLVRQGNNGALKPTCRMGRMLRPLVDRGYPPFEPDLLLDAEMDLGEFGVSARIVFTPGHTPGSISVLTQENEIIVGDLLMGGYFGGWLSPTCPGLHYFADDLGQLYASVRTVLDVGPGVVHPGHGGPLRRDAIRRRFS